MWFWIKLSLDFLVVGLDFLLIFMCFYDMGCDKGFGDGGIVILADFVVDLGFLMIKF